MLEMNARSLQQKLESERDVKQRLLDEVRFHICLLFSLLHCELEVSTCLCYCCMCLCVMMRSFPL